MASDASYPEKQGFKGEVNLAQLTEIEEKYTNIQLIIAHIGRAYAKEDIGNAFDVVEVNVQIHILILQQTFLIMR